MQIIEEFGTQMRVRNPNTDTPSYISLGDAVEKLRERILEIPDMQIVTMTGDSRRLIVVFGPKPPQPLKLASGIAPLFDAKCADE